MRVIACLSGGVDSSVAALLLKQAGHEVVGLTFWFWSNGSKSERAANTCCGLDAAAQAAAQLGIPHHVVDASETFRHVVIDNYVTQLRKGLTPNPCGRCNRYVRFDLALSFARDNGFEAIATGHHIRRAVESDGSIALYRGTDANKDQTYFLYGLDAQDLAHIRFPIGEMTKEQIYDVARAAGLTAVELPESQDLCFAAGQDVGRLFSDADQGPGPIVDPSGNPIGTHDGLHRYTIGQRRGLAVPSTSPLYVVDIDAATNTIVVGPEEALLSDRLIAVDANYLVPPPDIPETVEAKIRYRSPAAQAALTQLSGDSFALTFQDPQRAITPGQLAVLYKGDRLLGGGTIVRNPSTQ